MIKKITLFSLAFLLALPLLPAQDVRGLLKKAKTAVTGEDGEDDIGMGLKQALRKGVEEGVARLSTENGYLESPYCILVPEEAQKVVSKLKMVPGFQDVEDKLILQMNRAAELAVEKAGPIFFEAIGQLTIRDAADILMGEPDAATRYLERTTREELYKEFRPVIAAALDEVGARDYWNKAVTAYNRIPLTKKVNPELDDHVTGEGLDGLFSLIEKKEEEIRKDPAARTTDLLQRVFSRQDK